ncbi:unnamed protein product [Cyprideis torosa]|uniref:Uncharacterized protein n=1 Tax=Cyprideis torosa TaxID=163714 RepID=A0A7R8WIX5_9CRUS|nr:unnamed protein product [Cyprideis torosa]CAG0901318.1 unnamed protein product [Cyprideis torosa]
MEPPRQQIKRRHSDKRRASSKHPRKNDGRSRSRNAKQPHVLDYYDLEHHEYPRHLLITPLGSTGRGGSQPTAIDDDQENTSSSEFAFGRTTASTTADRSYARGGGSAKEEEDGNDFEISFLYEGDPAKPGAETHKIYERNNFQACEFPQMEFLLKRNYRR